MAALHHITELTDEALLDEVGLQDFLDAEYSSRKNPPNIRTLRKRAASGAIPGARKDGKSWVVNMHVYRNFKRRQIEQSMLRPAPLENKLSHAERVTAILQTRNV